MATYLKGWEGARMACIMMRAGLRIPIACITSRQKATFRPRQAKR